VRDSCVYLVPKYNSIHIAIATIKIRFRKFPTPKYAKIKYNSIDIAPIKPRLLDANTKEIVKSKARNTSIKNKNTVPKYPGSTKYIKKNIAIQSNIVTISVGRKFFLFNTCCLRASLFIGADIIMLFKWMEL